MTDSTPTSPRGTDAPGDHFTVEDAGSTSDPADLGTSSGSTGTARAVGADGSVAPDTAGERTDAATTGTGSRPDGLASLGDDDSIGHVFDQTNGVIEGVEGDSDGTAESDVRSAAERGDENPDLFHDADVRGDGEADDSTRTGA
jgi:hypothetical protein